MEHQPNREFIKLFSFQEDKTKPGRTISSVKIGGVYMSRLVIHRGVTIGEYFHKETSVMFYVGRGSILGTFEQVNTKQRKQVALNPQRHAIHLPPYVAISLKNVAYEPAVLVVFSNRRLDSGDEYPYPLTQKN